MTNWPWPLDGVQDWFEDSINGLLEGFDVIAGEVKGFVDDMVSEAEETIRGWFEWLYKEVSKIVQGVSSTLEAWGSTLLKELQGAATWMSEHLEAGLKVILTTVDNIMREYMPYLRELFNTIMANIGPQIQSLHDSLTGGWDWLSKQLSDLGDEVGKQVSGLAEWVKSEALDPLIDWTRGIHDYLREVIGDVWENVRSVFAPLFDAITGIWKFISEDLPKKASELVAAIPGAVASVMSNAATWLNENVIRPVWSGLSWLFDWIMNSAREFINNLINALRGLTDAAWRGDIGGILAGVAPIIATGLGIQGILSVAGMKIAGTGIEVGELSSYLVRVIDPKDVIGAIVGSIVGTMIVRPLEHNLRSQARPTLPGPDDLRTFYLRHYIDEAKVKQTLSFLGYADEWIDDIMKSWWVIPSISDLIDFVVKEVITPDDFYRWAAMQGLSEEWARNYWEAHWRLPSFENLREAFWRGIITEDEFRKFIVWHDYKPEPRPGISKSDQDIIQQLSYKLPGSIDTRWMYEWNIISEDELTQLLKMQGLHPDWLEKVKEAYVKNILRDEVGRIRSAAERLYRDGYITEEQLREILHALGYRDEIVELTVMWARLDREREIKEDLQKLYINAFKKGQLTEDELMAYLQELGMSPQQAYLAARLAGAEKETKPPRPREILGG